MTSLLRRPLTRWLAPVAAALTFIGAGSVVTVLTNAAQADLAPRSAAQLLVDIQNARLAGLSGTIVQNADLGLPALPASLPGGGSDLTSLVSGSHTLRTWYAGAEHVRLSLMGQFGESDLIRNGSDVWIWSSSTRSAEHWVLPVRAGDTPPKTSSSPLPEQALTPQQAAEKALQAISPTTSVTTNGTAIVAGRPAYLLTLQPRTPATLVDSVQIAIDGRTHVPTRVQLFAKGMNSPAFSVGFTSFDPSTPSMSVFGFNPPPGTKVAQRSTGPETPRLSGRDPGHATSEPAARPRIVGSGWTTVLVAQLPEGESGTADTATGPGGPLGGFLERLPRVSGPWGSGRLLEGTVFSVLLTDTGQVVAGAVPPSALYAALAAR